MITRSTIGVAMRKNIMSIQSSRRNRVKKILSLQLIFLIATCLSVNAQTFTMMDTILPPPGGFTLASQLNPVCSIPDSITCFDEVYGMVEISTAICNDTIFVEISAELLAGDLECNESFYRLTFDLTQSCPIPPPDGTLVAFDASCEGVTKISNTGPIIDNPADLVVECYAEIQDSITSQIARYESGEGVTISCDYGYTVTSSTVVSLMGDCNGQTYDVEYYIIEDECGMRTDTAMQTFTIVNSFPTLTCPPMDTVECHSDIASLAAMQSTNIEGTLILCDYNYTVTPKEVTFTDDCSMTLYNVEYLAEEVPCGRKDSCIQIIEILNNKPGITTCPADMTVTCFDDIAADTSALVFTTSCMLTATRAASAPVADAMNSACGEMSGDIYRIIYTVTDGCGRDSSCTQTFTIDNQGPMIVQSSCPPAVLISAPIFADTINDYKLEDVVLSGEICDTIIIKGSVEVIAVGMDPMCDGQTLQIKYYVVDQCQRRDSCVQVINTIGGNDTTPPMAVCPPDTTVDCDLVYPAAMTYAEFDDLDGSATDNCDAPGDLDVTSEEVKTNIGQPCVQNFVLERTYIITDQANNEVSCVQLITVQDTIGPDLNVTLPNFTGLSCTDTIPDAITEIDSFFVYAGLDFQCALTGSGIGVSMPMTGSGTGICVDNCVNNSELWVNHIDSPASVGDLSFCPLDNNTITRTYYISDNCGNFDTLEQRFIFEEINEGPILDCQSDTILITDSKNCFTRELPTPPGVTSVCGSGLDSLYIVNMLDSLTIGEHIITWEAKDSCKRHAFCNQTVVVKDKTAPTITCNGDSLAICMTSSTLTMGIDQIAHSVNDNCDDHIDVAFSLDGSTFTPTIDFTCSDIDSVIMITIRAMDLSGNSSICMTAVVLSDCVPPVFNACLHPITVTCTDTLNLGNLSNLGSIAELIVTDQCGLDTIVELIPLDTGFKCKSGGGVVRTVTRIFEATDIHGNKSTCEQEISVINDDPFTEEDIMWLPDIEVACGASTSVDSLGQPGIMSDACSQILFDHRDMTFDLQTNACRRIMRIWKVIDWCQFDRDAMPVAGQWIDTQYIDIVSGLPPVLNGPFPDKDLCATDCSGGRFQMSFDGRAGCAEFGVFGYLYNIQLEDGRVIQSTGNNIDQELPLGTHNVILTIKDNCHQISTESFKITMKDCKAPALVCINGLVVNLMDTTPPMVPLWASDFSNGTKDNCTAESEIIYSFTADTSATQQIFTCNQADRNLGVTIFATDEHGNQSSCETRLEVQSNGINCAAFLEAGEDVADEETEEEENVEGESTNSEDEVVTQTDEVAMVSGLIATYKGEGIMNTEVNIQSPAMDEYKITSEGGDYAFESLDMYKDYMVRPSKNDDVLNGVSTLDIVLIQKHILGLNIISDPYLRIAADVNGSKHVSATDLVELRKLILGSIEAFSNNQSWRFVDASYDLDQNDPWNFPEEVEYLDLENNQMSTDFVGIKVGDINGNASVNLSQKTAETRSSEKMVLAIENTSFNDGDNLIVELVADKAIELSGMQLAFRIDDNLELVDVISDKLNIRNDHYRIVGNELIISWTQNELAEISVGDELFKLALRAKGSGRVLESIQLIRDRLPAEVYDGDLEIFDLVIDAANSDRVSFKLYQNKPNPFIAATEIEFYLPRTMEASLITYDVKGQILLKKTARYESGLNHLLVTKDELGISSGVIYYRLEAGDYSGVKTMILIE